MRLSRLLRPASAIAGLALLAGCGGSDAEPPPRPMDAGAPGEAPAGAGPAQAPAAPATGDPRMVLFDVQTALEAGRAAQGAYPVPAAFRYEERWRVQRERLEAAFDGWDYRSDGDTFTLRGTIDERAWDVSGP